MHTKIPPSKKLRAVRIISLYIGLGLFFLGFGLISQIIIFSKFQMNLIDWQPLGIGILLSSLGACALVLYYSIEQKSKV